VAAISGRLLASQDTALTLAVSSTTRTNGVEDAWNGETVTVPRGSVASVEARTFSPLRSAIAGGAAVAVGAILYGALGSGGSGGGTGGTGPGGPH
jgi:hypothetical protein